MKSKLRKLSKLVRLFFYVNERLGWWKPLNIIRKWLLYLRANLRVNYSVWFDPESIFLIRQEFYKMNPKASFRTIFFRALSILKSSNELMTYLQAFLQQSWSIRRCDWWISRIVTSNSLHENRRQPNFCTCSQPVYKMKIISCY